MLFSGRYSDKFIALHIDDEGLSLEKARGEGREVHWSDIKGISLSLHNIRLQYKQTNARDKIELPACSYKQRQKLKATLSDAATEFDLKYGMV